MYFITLAPEIFLIIIHSDIRDEQVLLQICWTECFSIPATLSRLWFQLLMLKVSSQVCSCVTLGCVETAVLWSWEEGPLPTSLPALFCSKASFKLRSLHLIAVWATLQLCCSYHCALLILVSWLDPGTCPIIMVLPGGLGCGWPWVSPPDVLCSSCGGTMGLHPMQVRPHSCWPSCHPRLPTPRSLSPAVQPTPLLPGAYLGLGGWYLVAGSADIWGSRWKFLKSISIQV